MKKIFEAKPSCIATTRPVGKAYYATSLGRKSKAWRRDLNVFSAALCVSLCPLR